ARQDRLLQRPRRDGKVAQQLDPAIRGRRPGQFFGDHQGEEAARGSFGHGAGCGRQPRLLHFGVFAEAALPVGRPGRVIASRVQAAEREDCLGSLAAKSKEFRPYPIITNKKQESPTWLLMHSCNSATSKASPPSKASKSKSSSSRGRGACRKAEPPIWRRVVAPAKSTCKT